MIKAKITKEIMITNKEIAQILLEDESIFDGIDEILKDMLYTKYKMDYDSRCDAVAELTKADYIQILESLANIMRIENMKG